MVQVKIEETEIILSVDIIIMTFTFPIALLGYFPTAHAPRGTPHRRTADDSGLIVEIHICTSSL